MIAGAIGIISQEDVAQLQSCTAILTSVLAGVGAIDIMTNDSKI